MTIDIIAVLCLILGLFLGYSRGFFRGIIMFIAAMLSFWACLKAIPGLGKIIAGLGFLSDQISWWIALGLIVIFFYFLISLIDKEVKFSFKNKSFQYINKIAGAIILALIFLLSYSSVLLFGAQSRFISKENTADSFSYEYLDGAYQKTKNSLKTLNPFFDSMGGAITQIGSHLKGEHNEEEE